MSTPRRPDETALWAAVVAGESPRTAAARLGIHPGRAEYLCEKWATRGIYNYGVSCTLGWVEKWAQIEPVCPAPEWEAKDAAIRAMEVRLAVEAATATATARVGPLTVARTQVAAESPFEPPQRPARGPGRRVPWVFVRVEFNPTLVTRYPHPGAPL